MLPERRLDTVLKRDLARKVLTEVTLFLGFTGV
jgi:hypothetical protein